MTLFDVLISLAGIAAIPILLYFMGQYIPPMPILNEWKLRVNILEKRENGEFPRWDYGKIKKNTDGDDMLYLKNSKQSIIPKGYMDFQRGSDGKNYLYLIQTSKENFIVGRPVLRDNEGEEMTKAKFDVIMKTENIFNWKKYKMINYAKKIIKEPQGLMKHIYWFAPFMMIISVGIFFILVVEPINAIYGSGQSLLTVQQQTAVSYRELQEVNLEIAESLRSIAVALGGG